VHPPLRLNTTFDLEEYEQEIANINENEKTMFQTEYENPNVCDLTR
jgi:hypothetical protein